jgi:hypothetical protein
MKQSHGSAGTRSMQANPGDVMIHVAGLDIFAHTFCTTLHLVNWERSMSWSMSFLKIKIK